MTEASPSFPTLGKGGQALLVAACAILVIGALKVASTLLAPLALALFLAFLSFPLVFWLQARGWPSVLATVATMTINVAVVGVVVFLAFISVGDFEEKLPLYKERTQVLYESSIEWLETRGYASREDLSLDTIQPGAVFDFTRKSLASLMGIASNGALVILVMLFALLEAGSIPGKIRYIFGHSDGNPERFHKIVREILLYLWIKTLVSIATGVFVGVGAWIIGVDFPVLWGLLTFALNYIPTIGSILAAIPSVLLALVQLGWGAAAAFLGVTVVANVIFGNIVEPMLMGKRLGLSTLVVTLALVFWGWLWGPIGMLLSVPLTMVVKIVVQNIPDLSWVAVLLSDWKGTENDPRIEAAEEAMGDSAEKDGSKTDAEKLQEL
jgi:predicted PurR-regulated permease PerM